MFKRISAILLLLFSIVALSFSPALAFSTPVEAHKLDKMIRETHELANQCLNFMKERQAFYRQHQRDIDKEIYDLKIEIIKLQNALSQIPKPKEQAGLTGFWGNFLSALASGLFVALLGYVAVYRQLRTQSNINFINNLLSIDIYKTQFTSFLGKLHYPTPSKDELIALCEGYWFAVFFNKFPRSKDNLLRSLRQNNINDARDIVNKLLAGSLKN